MPDFTILQMQQCKKLSISVMQIEKYMVTGLGSERMYPQCTCPAYKYAKRDVFFNHHWYPQPCKHIFEAQRQLSCWSEQCGDEAQTDDQREKMICPKCGGETEWVNVAV